MYILPVKEQTTISQRVPGLCSREKLDFRKGPLQKIWDPARRLITPWFRFSYGPVPLASCIHEYWGLAGYLDETSFLNYCIDVIAPG